MNQNRHPNGKTPNSQMAPGHSITRAFGAALGTTAVVIGLMLSTPAFAEHGGERAATGARPQATPTYDAWLAQSKSDQARPRQEASAGNVMTDAAIDTNTHAVTTESPRRSQFWRPSR